MAGFTKLSSSIITSTLWQEDSDTCKIWITMLALADVNGFVDSTIPGLANLANVSIQATEEAIRKFQSPDPYSRTQEHEGRRIEEVEHGWLLLTYAEHRKKADKEARREYLRKKKQESRERLRKQQESTPVNSGQQKTTDSTQAEAEAEAEEQNPPISPQGDDAQSPADSGCHKAPPEVQQVFDAWNTHAGKSVKKPNDQGTVRTITWKPHRVLSKDKIVAIHQALKDYPVEDVVGAINNFAVVLLGREYFWSYPWTLNEFLTRSRERHKGAERQWWQFLPDNFDAERYCRHGAEAEVLYEDPTVEEALAIARKLDRQAEERKARAAI